MNSKNIDTGNLEPNAKAELIDRILGIAKQKAKEEGKEFKGAHLFFDLAFMDDNHLRRFARIIGA